MVKNMEEMWRRVREEGGEDKGSLGGDGRRRRTEEGNATWQKNMEEMQSRRVGEEGEQGKGKGSRSKEQNRKGEVNREEEDDGKGRGGKKDAYELCLLYLWLLHDRYKMAVHNWDQIQVCHQELWRKKV